MSKCKECERKEAEIRRLKAEYVSIILDSAIDLAATDPAFAEILEPKLVEIYRILAGNQR